MESSTGPQKRMEKLNGNPYTEAQEKDYLNIQKGQVIDIRYNEKIYLNCVIIHNQDINHIEVKIPEEKLGDIEYGLGKVIIAYDDIRYIHLDDNETN